LFCLDSFHAGHKESRCLLISDFTRPQQLVEMESCEHCLDWTWITILPISASQIGRIIGLNHHIQPKLCFRNTKSLYLRSDNFWRTELLLQDEAWARHGDSSL
jgi:hypothetical protein